MSAAPRAGGGALLALAAAVALPGFAPAREPRACEAPGSGREAHGRTIELACAGASGPLRGATRLLYGLGLDPNRAEAGALEALPQIGVARARAWVAARAEGPFCAPEDLERVPGIGPNRRKALETWLEFAETGGCKAAPTGRKKLDRGVAATVR